MKPEKRWVVSLDTISLTREQALIVRIGPAEVSGFRSGQCSIARVEKHDDEWMLTQNVPILLDEGGSAMLSISIRELAPGSLHRVSQVILIPSDAANPDEVGSQSIRPTGLLFEVRAQGEQARLAEDLAAQYEQITQQRQADFLSGIGDKDPDSVEYEAFIFVKNCLLQTRMRVGAYQLIPFKGLGCLDELALINDFLAAHGASPIDTAAAPGHGDLGEPCFVVHFPRVLASTVQRAGEIVHEEVRLLCDVLGLHRQSYGAAFGGLLVHRDTGERFHWIDTPLYSGNLAAGSLGGEVSQLIRADLSKARTDPRVALHLSLFREAMREERTEFVYFRFWNLLETIARSKAFEGKPRMAWDGTAEQSPKGKPLTIENKAEQIVFELLRSTLAPQTVSARAFGQLGKQGSFEELVPIWYRHRNCVVHGGGCSPNDTSFCLRTVQKYIHCKSAHDEVVAAQGARNRFTDGYLQALRQTTLLIVQAECR